MKVQIVNKSNNALPKYETSGASGMDVRAELSLINPKFLFHSEMNEGKLIISPGGRALIPTGIHLNIPEGYEIQVRARSGLALKKGISLTNGVATIDEDYKGDIGIILMNNGFDPFVVEQGDRIAQIILAKVDKIAWEEVEVLTESERGEGGFNSTGVK